MKILVIDDHPLIGEALCSVLKELKGDAEVFVASNCAQAMQLVEGNANFSLVLLDLGLPDRDGFSVLEELLERYPATSIVVLSARQDRDNVLKALDLGALGFIPKSASRQIMLRALELVFAGGVYVPPEILVHEQSSEQTSNHADAYRPPILPSELGLTERQLDVLALITQGKNNKTICRLLNLAEPTVENHVTNILRALKVTNRTEAMIAVNKFGWDLP